MKVSGNESCQVGRLLYLLNPNTYSVSYIRINVHIGSGVHSGEDRKRHAMNPPEDRKFINLLYIYYIVCIL